MSVHSSHWRLRFFFPSSIECSQKSSKYSFRWYTTLQLSSTPMFLYYSRISSSESPRLLEIQLSVIPSEISVSTSNVTTQFNNVLLTTLGSHYYSTPCSPIPSGNGLEYRFEFTPAITVSNAVPLRQVLLVLYAWQCAVETARTFIFPNRCRSKSQTLFPMRSCRIVLLLL